MPPQPKKRSCEVAQADSNLQSSWLRFIKFMKAQAILGFSLLCHTKQPRILREKWLICQGTGKVQGNTSLCHKDRVCFSTWLRWSQQVSGSNCHCIEPGTVGAVGGGWVFVCAGANTYTITGWINNGIYLWNQLSRQVWTRINLSGNANEKGPGIWKEEKGIQDIIVTFVRFISVVITCYLWGRWPGLFFFFWYVWHICLKNSSLPNPFKKTAKFM